MHSLTGRESISRPPEESYTPSPLSAQTLFSGERLGASFLPALSWDAQAAPASGTAGSHTVAQNWHHDNKDRVTPLARGGRDVWDGSTAVAEQAAPGSQHICSREQCPLCQAGAGTPSAGMATRHFSFPGHSSTLQQLFHNFMCSQSCRVLNHL